MPGGIAGRMRTAKGGLPVQRRRGPAPLRILCPTGYPLEAGPASRQAALPERVPVKTWQAPRLAYELAADWAEEVAAAPCRGGCGAHLVRGKGWLRLSEQAQRDVLTALSAQTRGALWDMRHNEQLPPDAVIELDTSYFDHQLCAVARDTLDVLLSPSDPGGAWELPACPHCAAVLAVALIAIHVSLLVRAGIADPAALLRSLADGAARIPAPRQGEQ